MSNDLFKAPRSVFTGPEFRGLSVRAKLLYLAVCAHPGLSACGVGRWDEEVLATLCPDLTYRECMAAGFELMAAGLIVFDPVAGLVGPRGFLSWINLGQERVANAVIASFYDASSLVVISCLAMDGANWAVGNSRKSTFAQVDKGLRDLVDRIDPDNLVRRLRDIMSLMQNTFNLMSRVQKNFEEKSDLDDMVYNLLNSMIVGISTFPQSDYAVSVELLTKFKKTHIIDINNKDVGVNSYISKDDTYVNDNKAYSSKDDILASNKSVTNNLQSSKLTYRGKKPRLQLVSNTSTPEPVENLPLPVDNFSEPVETKSTRKRATYSAEFEQFWAAFPKARRVGKKGAYAKWQQVIRKGEATFEEIMEGLERYKAGWNPAYYHMPTTWLNKGLWDGDYQPRARSTMQRFAAIAMQAAEDQNNNTQWEENENEF
nr:MAG TPA: putative replisome organizer protein [Caudoviricetes sp.]